MRIIQDSDEEPESPDSHRGRSNSPGSQCGSRIAALQQQTLHVAVGPPPTGLKRTRATSSFEAKSSPDGIKRRKSDQSYPFSTKPGPSVPDFTAYLDQEAFQTSPDRGTEDTLPQLTGEAAWDLQPTLREDFIQHEPAGMFSEQSSTVPDTQLQARIAETSWSDLVSNGRSQDHSTRPQDLPQGAMGAIRTSSGNAANSAEASGMVLTEHLFDSSIRTSGLSDLGTPGGQDHGRPLFEPDLPRTPGEQTRHENAVRNATGKKSASTDSQTKKSRKKSQKSRAGQAALESLQTPNDNTFVAKPAKKPRRTRTSPAVLIRPRGSNCEDDLPLDGTTEETQISVGEVSPPTLGNDRLKRSSIVSNGASHRTDRQEDASTQGQSVVVVIPDEESETANSTKLASPDKPDVQPSIVVEQAPPTAARSKKGRGRLKRAANVVLEDNPQSQDNSVVESNKAVVPNEPSEQSRCSQELTANGAESPPVDATSEASVVDASSKGPTKDAKRDVRSGIMGVPHRVGLSRRVRIAPLLKVVRK